MKKICLGLLMAVSLLAAPQPGQAYPPQITVLVNGQPVPFDQPPIMEGARVLVPLRGIFQQLGATVVYNPGNRSINAQQGPKSISLAIGSHTAYISGQPNNLDTAPILMGGRALVPLRFLAQALNANVDWHPDRYLVTVTSGLPVPPPEAQQPEHYGGPPEHYGAQAFIRDVSISTRGPLMAGQNLNVRLFGSPHGMATFDVGRVHNLPMLEEHPGEYTAVYTVRADDHERDARVIGHLQLPDGAHARQESRDRVTLGELNGPPPPQAGYLITSVTHNGTRPLYPGQLLEVTMTGVPGGEATFGVGYIRNIPMREVSPGTYIGTFTIPAGPPNPAVQVVARLSLPNGQTQSRRGPNLNLVGGP